MRGLDVHENIDVSDTKLMLGLLVCFISSDLTVNKLFPINPRVVTGPPKMSLLLEVETTSSLIIEPKLILVTYTDDLGGYITSNQQGKMLVQNLHRIVTRTNVTPGQIRIAQQTVLKLTWCFRKSFLLTHYGCEQPVPSKWPPRSTSDPSYQWVLQQQPV